MMRATEFMQGVAEGVTESFDQPYRIKWEKGAFGDLDAIATLEDGTNLVIMFNNEVFQWMVEFYRSDRQDITGEGDAQRVFATVLKAIREFIRKKKPISIVFGSVKEADPRGSRTRLYDRLVQRYSNDLGYTLQKQEEPSHTVYRLNRKQDVSEGRIKESRTMEVVVIGLNLAEGMASRIDQWIEDTLARITGEPRDWDKMTDRLRSRVDRAAAAAPTEPISRELIDKILADQRIQREMEQLAWQQKTTVEKIKAMIYAFGGKFVARAVAKWRGMSDREKRELLANTVKALLELVLIILRALAKSRR